MGKGLAAIRLPIAHCLLPFGAIAQLGERVLCKHEVVGSIPSGSTRIRDVNLLNLPSMKNGLPVGWRSRNAFFRERGLGGLSGRAKTI